MTKQSQKVAIVTGASGGIGAAVAERLAKDGFTVVVNYAGNVASADAVVARIEAAGGRAVAAQADIADTQAVRRMFESAETAFGGVDVLINNAGILSLATIAESDDALFDRLIAVNLKGTFNTLREAAPAHRRADRELLLERRRLAAAHLWHLRQHQGRGRGDDRHPRQGVAGPEHHGQCDRPRTDGNQAVSRR
jgi:NAD(P)-dependent dehydrogenase (short-subunit alcohol dehydrogenase family)